LAIAACYDRPMPSTRRFPPPWTIDDHNDACFIVKDKTGYALAYVYYEEEPLDGRDERDAESILSTIESEFRRTLEAEQTFMAWRRDTPNAPFAERLRRYAAWAEASEPFAASYRRISTAFRGYMDRLQELLLPVLREIIVPY
jgi:hypothetical protein